MVANTVHATLPVNSILQKQQLLLFYPSPLCHVHTKVIEKAYRSDSWVFYVVPCLDFNLNFLLNVCNIPISWIFLDWIYLGTRHSDGVNRDSVKHLSSVFSQLA